MFRKNARRFILPATIAFLLLMAVLAAMPAVAFADFPSVFAQGDGTAMAKTQSRSYTVEWLIVGALFAAALYAVCKSSRRT